MGKYFSEEFIKNLLKMVYWDVIRPAAEAYVNKTDNQWDNSALAFLDGLAQNYLGPK